MSNTSAEIFKHVSERQYKELDQLLDQDKAFIDAKNIKGNTALMNAVLNKDIRLVDVLIKHGANPDIKNDLGDFPLDYAAETNQKEIIDLLIKGGANLDLPNRSGVTALYTSVTFGFLEAAEKIYNAGAQLETLTNKDGNSILAVASSVGNLQSFNWLLATGKMSSLINKPNNVLETPLMFASMAQSDFAEDICKLLLDNGADPKMNARSGQNALANAMLTDKQGVSLRMIKMGVNVNIVDNYSETPLIFYGAFSKNKDLFESMLISGADLDIKNPDGQTLLETMLSSPNKEMMSLFLKYYNGTIKDKYSLSGEKIDLLQYAVFCKDEELITQAINLGCDIDYINETGLCALDVSFMMLDEKSFNKLLKLGAQINLPNKEGDIPLHKISKNIKSKTLTDLEAILGMVSKNKQAAGGVTSEELTELKNKRLETASNFLNEYISRKVDINTKNNDGQTPLMVAAVSNNTPVAEKLLENYASVKEVDNDSISTFKYIVLSNLKKELKDLHFANTTKEDMFKDFLDFVYVENESILNWNQRQKYIKTVFELMSDSVHYFKDYQDEDGNNLLAVCVATKQEDLVRALIDCGVNANHVNNFSESALFYAISTKNVLALDLLLETKPDLNLKNVDGLTVLDLLSQKKNENSTVRNSLEKYIGENNIMIIKEEEKVFKMFNPYK